MISTDSDQGERPQTDKNNRFSEVIESRKTYRLKNLEVVMEEASI